VRTLVALESVWRLLHTQRHAREVSRSCGAHASCSIEYGDAQPVDYLVASKGAQSSPSPVTRQTSPAASPGVVDFHMSGDLDDVGCLNLVVGAEDRALGSLPLSSFVEPPAR